MDVEDDRSEGRASRALIPSYDRETTRHDGCEGHDGCRGRSGGDRSERRDVGGRSGGDRSEGRGMLALTGWWVGCLALDLEAELGQGSFDRF